MTDTQRTWVLRKDRWVECHDWHIENIGTEDRQVGWVSWMTVMTDTQRTWVLRTDRWIECHDWHTENMGTEDRQVGWVSWLTHREHGYWGQTGGLSAMTDTQRTWVLRMDRWVECHDWHTENMGTEGGQVGWVSWLTQDEQVDMWGECHDWHTENMGTEDGQVGWVPWHTPRVSWHTSREPHSQCESKSMTATKHVKRETKEQHGYCGSTGGLRVMCQDQWRAHKRVSQSLGKDSWLECQAGSVTDTLLS